MIRKVMVGCLLVMSLAGCKTEKREEQSGLEELTAEELAALEPEEMIEFGYDLNKYLVIRDTIRQGESFGSILERNHIDFPTIYKIAEVAKDSFDITSLQAGKPYTLLCDKKDTLQRPRCFIYQPNSIEYVVVDFTDTTQVIKGKKPVRIVQREASGVIESSLYETFQNRGLSTLLAYRMSDIYAWTIDFFRIQKGDRFKVIYTEKYIDDTIYAGIDRIHAAYFEHQGEPVYAFRFETDSTKHIVDYFDENAKNLRRAFLRAPVQFSRISSRYNLKRRIAFYGNKVRPHKGTDFAAPVGTPILATSNGTVVESAHKGGNGNYVKIKHNATYSTQYLHMSKRNVKPGQYVRQGEVIGWVGMTGNTSGPHVCYRFWKNGAQVDPFREKLPNADPIQDELKVRYLEYIQPVKQQLDNISFDGNRNNKDVALLKQDDDASKTQSN